MRRSSMVRATSNIDHDPRAPALRRALDAELVEGDGLRVGAPRRARGIDGPAPHGGPQREGTVARDADVGAREDRRIAVLEKDELGEPVVQEEIEGGCLEGDRAG